MDRIYIFFVGIYKKRLPAYEIIDVL